MNIEITFFYIHVTIFYEWNMRMNRWTDFRFTILKKLNGVLILVVFTQCSLFILLTFAK